MDIKRLVDKKELLGFLPVIRGSFQTVADDFGFTPENNASNAAFMTEAVLAVLPDKADCYGFYHKGTPAGFFALEKGAGTVWYLEKLCVLPALRHEGFGRKLLDKAFQEAALKGAEEISIGIVNENTVLKNWYEAYGFEETGTKIFSHLPFTVCFMKKRVKD